MLKIADFTKLQLDQLELTTGQPLIISDADEVIVHFATPLEQYLRERGYNVSFDGYKLEGSIRRITDHSVVDVHEIMPMIEDFFEGAVDEQPPVNGAVDALNSLKERAQVIVLTNLPDSFRSRRAAAFANLGLSAPVITNTGLKGSSVKVLADRVQAPVVFIDDTEPHIRSVAQEVPHCYRVHFIADERLAKIHGRAPDSHHRSDCWVKTHDAITDFLSAEGF